MTLRNLHNKIKCYFAKMGRNSLIIFCAISFLGAVASIFSIVYDILIIGWYFQNRFDATEFLFSAATLTICLYVLWLHKINDN